MLQWLCVGWITGLAFMGRNILNIQLSTSLIMLIAAFCYLGCSIFNPLLNTPLRRFVIVCLMSIIGMMLGQGYANQQLSQRLLNVEHKVQQKKVVVYIKNLNKLGSSSIQQPLEVLITQGDAIKWMGFLAPSSLKKAVDTQNTHGSTLELGRYYLLQGEVRPTHSYATPGAFDAEKWALEQNVMAGFRIQNIQQLDPAAVYALGYGRHLREQRTFQSRFLLWVEKQRLQLRAFILRQPVQNKGLLLALLTGDESLLEPATQEQFRRFGMSHLLAISGPHVLIFALMCCSALQWMVSRYSPLLYLRWPRQYFLSVPFLLCVLLYCAFVGFEVPAMRTMLICVLGIITMILRQQVQALKLLILSAALLLLFDPFSILSAAFWLSYGACFVLLRIYQTIQQQPRELQPSTWQRLSLAGKVLVESQWKIFLALFPLMMLFFKQLAWITPFSNLVAIPWIGLLIVPLDILAAVMFFIAEPFSSVLFQLNDLLLQILLAFLNVLDYWFKPQLIPFAMNIWMIGLMILALLIVFMPRGVLPKSWAALSCVPLCIPQFYAAPFQLSILDVGQGQAIFIRNGQHSMMVDMGGYYDEEKFSVGRQIIMPFLSVQGVAQLDQLILTHLDQDHSGAYYSIKNQLKVKEIYANETLKGDQSVPFQYCHAGMQWQWRQQVKFTVLSPPIQHLSQTAINKNENSCVLHIEIQGGAPYQNFLLMGDAGWQTEFYLLQHYPALKVDVLVLGHHGSKHSSAYEFLKHYQPKLAIASAGRFNRYGHPSGMTQARLDALEIPLITTIEKGTIEFSKQEQNMLVHAYRDKFSWLKRN